MVITSKDNEIIKHIRKLKEKKYRDEYNEFIIEGIKMLEEAIQEKAIIKTIIICDDCKNQGVFSNELLYEIAKLNCIYVSEKIFNIITDLTNPQGIMAILEKPENNEKTIDYNEQWTSANKIIDYGRSLITQNLNFINSVTLEFDKDPNLKIGDVVNVQMPSFFVIGNFAVKEIDYTYKNKIEQNWKITLKSADLVSTYIDIFRPTEQQESENSIDTVILSEFVEENIYERHAIEVEDNNEN